MRQWAAARTTMLAHSVQLCVAAKATLLVVLVHSSAAGALMRTRLMGPHLRRTKCWTMRPRSEADLAILYRLAGYMASSAEGIQTTSAALAQPLAAVRPTRPEAIGQLWAGATATSPVALLHSSAAGVMTDFVLSAIRPPALLRPSAVALITV